MRMKTNSSAATDTAVVQTEWLKQDDITLLDGFTDADVDKVLPEADEADTILGVNMTAIVVVGAVTMVESYVDSARIKIHILNLYQHIFFTFIATPSSDCWCNGTVTSLYTYTNISIHVNAKNYVTILLISAATSGKLLAVYVTIGLSKLISDKRSLVIIYIFFGPLCSCSYKRKWVWL